MVKPYVTEELEELNLYREPGKILVRGFWFHPTNVVKLSEVVAVFRPDGRKGERDPWVLILKTASSYYLNDAEAASLIEALRAGAG